MIEEEIKTLREVGILEDNHDVKLEDPLVAYFLLEGLGYIPLTKAIRSTMGKVTLISLRNSVMALLCKPRMTVRESLSLSLTYTEIMDF